MCSGAELWRLVTGADGGSEARANNGTERNDASRNAAVAA
jgi:hypothetical protein